MCILKDILHGQGNGRIRASLFHIYNMCALLAIGAWSNLSRNISALFWGKNTIIVDECLLSNPVTLHNGWLTLQSLQLVDDYLKGGGLAL
jgi:hypothetical protein